MDMHFGPNLDGFTSHDIKVAQKVWGEEKIISQDPYGAKIMVLYPGFQVSIHFHSEKSECFILIEGELTVEVISPTGETTIIQLTEPYSSVNIPKNTPHTFYTPDEQEFDTVFIEASTVDKSNDSYRICPSGPRK